MKRFFGVRNKNNDHFKIFIQGETNDLKNKLCQISNLTFFDELDHCIIIELHKSLISKCVDILSRDGYNYDKFQI